MSGLSWCGYHGAEHGDARLSAFVGGNALCAGTCGLVSMSFLLYVVSFPNPAILLQACARARARAHVRVCACARVRARARVCMYAYVSACLVRARARACV